jgi:hypothetical protein
MTILTIANGSLPLTLRKGETLVIRNYSGAETVTGSSSIRELSANGLASYGPQPVDVSVVLSSGGSLDYQIVVGDVTTQNNDFLVSGASRPVIAFFGHSFQQQGNYGWRAPWGASQSGSITGVGFVGLERKSSGSARVLSFNAADKTCTFDGGPVTALVDGFQIIPGATAMKGVAVVAELDGLQSTNGTLTLTRSGSRPDEIVDSKSVAWWTNVFGKQGYLVRVYGHGGGEIQHCAPIARRAPAFDGFVIDYATNDIAEADTLANMQSEMIAALDEAYSKSRAKKGVVLGGCPYRTGFSAAQAEIMDAFNRWLPGALKAYPGVVARFPWQRLVNDAGTGGNTLMMNADNVHPSDPAAQYAGLEIHEYFDRVLPGTPWDFGAAVGRWSATNPSGNLISNPNPAGNNSGQPTNWGTLSVQASGTATPTKVARTDGVAGEWARITGGASADNISHSYTIPTTQFPDPPANGTVLQAFIEVRLTGALQMVPLLLLTELKAGSVVAWSRVNSSSDNKSLQMTEWVGVIATPPYVWSDTAGAPTLDIRIGQRLNNGASGAILDIGRIWVGTPEEYSIF